MEVMSMDASLVDRDPVSRQAQAVFGLALRFPSGSIAILDAASHALGIEGLSRAVNEI
jgi:hypothetical protein